MKECLEKWARSPKCTLYLLIGSGVAIFLARAIGSKLILPVAMTLVIYPAYAFDLSQGRRDLALRHVLFWAFVSSVIMIGWVRYDAAEMGKIVFKGISYRDEMFRWVLTGQGAEGELKLFLPEHLKHFSIFCVATLISAGVWGLAFGAVLLNYMNFYVGSLSLQAHHPLIIFLFGWPVWSLCRAVGFVLCGIALSEPLLSQLLRSRLNLRKCMKYFWVGLLFILADVLLKATLAPFWQGLLRGAVSF